MAKRGLRFGALAVVMAFGMAFTGCGGGGGTFTLNGIPREFNGMYAFFRTTGTPLLGGFQRADISGDTERFTLARVANGRVVLPTWVLERNNNDNRAQWHRYTGNAWGRELFVEFYSVRSIEGSLRPEERRIIRHVNFENGSATASWPYDGWW